MDIIIVIGIVVFLLLFFLQGRMFLYNLKVVGDSVVVDVVTAGDFKRDTPEKIPVIIDLDDSEKNDKMRQTLKNKEYEPFLVSGYSMLLANIQSNNFVLIKKGNKLTPETQLPCVVVLERDVKSLKRAEEENDFAKYKLRRAWLVCSIADCQENGLDSILSSEEFKKLFEDNKRYFMSHQEMKDDFLEYRMKKYIEDYPYCKDVSSPYHQVVVSTTWHSNPSTQHTETYNKVTFSIHPLVLVKGIVAKTIATETN